MASPFRYCKVNEAKRPIRSKCQRNSVEVAAGKIVPERRNLLKFESAVGQRLERDLHHGVGLHIQQPPSSDGIYNNMVSSTLAGESNIFAGDAVYQMEVLALFFSASMSS